MKSFYKAVLFVLLAFLLVGLMRTFASILLFIAFVVFDAIAAFGLLVHCDGRCRGRFITYFKETEPFFRKMLVAFVVVFILTMPHPLTIAAVAAMAIHLGWFNFTTTVARSYLRDVYGD